MATLVFVFYAAMPSTAMAGLTLNFLPVPINQRVPNITNIDCTTPTSGGCVRGSSFTDPDKTPFYQELVTDQGLSYYHVMIGDPSSAFAQEYYIAVATLPGGGINCCWPNGAPFSSSSGVFNGGADLAPAFKGWADPLSAATLSGSGTGNPERVIFRQVVQDKDFNQETRKLSFLNKPAITQTLITPEIQSLFSFDMSNSTYRDPNTTGVMTNRIVLFNVGQPSPFLDFDVVSNLRSSKLTGGRFTFAPGLGVGDSFGTFQYLEGGFDPYLTDWFPYSNTTNIPNK